MQPDFAAVIERIISENQLDETFTLWPVPWLLWPVAARQTHSLIAHHCSQLELPCSVELAEQVAYRPKTPATALVLPVAALRAQACAVVTWLATKHDNFQQMPSLRVPSLALAGGAPLLRLFSPGTKHWQALYGVLYPENMRMPYAANPAVFETRRENRVWLGLKQAEACQLALQLAHRKEGDGFPPGGRTDLPGGIDPVSYFSR